MKKKLFVVLIVLAMLAGVFTVLSVSADEGDPELRIAACNLSFSDSVYIKYAVTGNSTSGAKLLIWKDPQTDYEYGTQNDILDPSETTTISGQSALVFDYKKLAAKQMGDVIYARAYVERQGNIYYSEVKKYSIMQYVYNKTGRTGTASTNQNLIDLLNAMLEYGAKAQIYFNYKTDRLVNADYYQISVVNGTLTDGCGSGLYAVGESVTMTAPETDGNGLEFSYWKDENGINVGTDKTLTVTAISLNKTYTAVYGEEPPEPPTYSIGLAYSSNGDGTCTITGIGTCTDTDIVIPSEIDGLVVSAIGYNAFNGCSSLTSVTIPDSVTSISDSAFYGCSGLTGVTIGSSVNSIGWYAFRGCTGLTSVTIPDSVTILYGGTFYECTNLTNVTIPDSVTSIGGSAFYGCTSLTSITIPDSVNSIEYGAFQNCSSLTGVTIGNSVTSIGGYAFYGCTSLTSVTIPDSVTSIGGGAFYGCTGLTSVIIPDNVTSIGYRTFEDCSRLQSITIGSGVNYIDHTNFGQCGALSSVYYNGTLETWCGIDFVNWDSNPCCNGASLYIGGELLRRIVIPDTITTIKKNAFYNCGNINNVVIPTSVTLVENYAFSGCGSRVYYLGTMEQWNNITISSNSDLGQPILIDESGLGYTDNGDGTCTIEGIGICEDNEVIIPETINGLTVISIGNNLGFYLCTNITSVTIPDSVTFIGSFAFLGCSNLTTIYYTGTEEQWNSIIENTFNYLTNVNIIFNYVP